MDLGTIPKVLVLSILFFHSCDKTENDKILLNIEFNITNIVSYTDSLIIEFNVEVSNGIPPYSYEWESPDSLTGNGPFIVILKNNFDFKLDVSDSKENKATKILSFETNSYLADSNYDYRNKHESGSTKIVPAAYGADLGAIWRLKNRVVVTSTFWYLLSEQEFCICW